MGTPYFDLEALINGEDYSDPLGMNKYLEEQKRKQEEEQALNDTFLGAITRFAREGPHDVSSLKDALVGASSVPFEMAQGPIDYLASKSPIFQQPHVVPAAKLLRSAIAPEVLPGDVGPISHHVIMGSQGPIETASPTGPEDVKNAQILSNIIGRGVEEAGAFGLNPANAAMGLEGLGGKAMSALFIPGMAQGMGEQIGTGISQIESNNPSGAAESFTGGALSALFTGMAGSHLASRGVKPNSEVRQSEEVSDPNLRLQAAEDSGKPGVKTKSLLVQSVEKQRFDNMVRQFLQRLDPELEKVFPGFNEQGKVSYQPESSFPGLLAHTVHPDSVAAGRLPEGEGIFLNPSELMMETGNLSKFAERLPQVLIHERFAHAMGKIHGMLQEDAEGNTYYMRDSPEGRQKIIVPKVRAGSSKTGPERAKYGHPDDFATEMQNNIAQHNPDILRLADEFRQNILNNPDIIAGLKRDALNEFAPKDYETTTVESVDPNHPTNKLRNLGIKVNDFLKRQLGEEKTTPEELHAELDQIQKLPQEKQLEAIIELQRTRGKDWRDNPSVGKRVQAIEDAIPTAHFIQGQEKIASDFFTQHKKIYGHEAFTDPRKKMAEESNQPSDPAKILHSILGELKLTKFNRATLASELKKAGLPDEMTGNVPALLDELESKGLINKRAAGTYTLNTGAPKKFSTEATKAEEKLPTEPGDLEAQLTKSLEGNKTEPVKETPPSESLPELTIEDRRKQQARARMEAQLAREESQRQRDQEIDKLTQQARNLKLSGHVEEANKINAQIQELRTKPLGEIPPKPEPPPKSLEQEMKENLTPAQIFAIDKVGKGKNVPEEVRIAQQAASQVRTKIQNKAKTEAKQRVADIIKKAQSEPVKEAAPSEPVEEPSAPKTKDEKVVEEVKAAPPEPPSTEKPKGKDKPRNWKVTLSDGSEHIVHAADKEQVQHDVEAILSQHGSTKTIDKIEPHLSTLERAATYEVDPVKAGSEIVTEHTQNIRKQDRDEAAIIGKQIREQQKLEKAQFKEKYAKKPFKVALSNGATVVVKARNEASARNYVESKLKARNSTHTITSIAEKGSALDEAIGKIAKRTEQSGILNNPIVKILNGVKSIAFGGDVGHLLRQGKQINADLLMSKHAKKVLEQIPVIFKSMKSEDYFTKFHEKLYNDPDIRVMVDNFDLDMPGMGKHYKEEVFHGAEGVENLPIIGKYYAKPSERAYTAGLNFLRGAEVKKLVGDLRKRGLTPENAPERYRAVARAVNIISQRGDFSSAYQKVFSDASAVYGAPRAKAARIQNFVGLWRGGESHAILRRVAAKTMGFNLAMYGLLKATTGAQLVTDPEASDWGKIRVNDKITVDPWMGLGVTARNVAHLLEGKRVSRYSGRAYNYNASDFLKDEFIGGIAPGVKLMYEMARGEDLRGYQVPRLASLLNVAPLTAKSIIELAQAEGDPADMIELAMLQAAGEGVDVFDYKKSQEQEQELRKERGLPISRRRRRGSANSSGTPNWMK